MNMAPFFKLGIMCLARSPYTVVFFLEHFPALGLGQLLPPRRVHVVWPGQRWVGGTLTL